MSELTLRVEKREQTGKNVNRRLRASGVLPAVVYGDQKPSVAIQVESKTVRDLIREGGENAVFLLQLAGSKTRRHAMIRAMDVHPISRQIIHIDFQRIRLSQKVRIQVAIELIGEPVGVKMDGGVLDFVSRELEVECLPTSIPQEFQVDVSDLHIGQHFEAGQIDFPDGVELLDEPNRVIVSVAHSRVQAELDAEAAEAEEEALLIEAEKAEPEVIGRGKEEEEPEEKD